MAIIDATALSQEEYVFILYHFLLRIRWRIRGHYSTSKQTVTISNMEEVVSSQLQEIKMPEKPAVRVITKESLTKNVETKEVFDYLYQLKPTFRQTTVENVKVEESDSIKKMFIMTKKEQKDYRLVVLKDIKSQELQLID